MLFTSRRNKTQERPLTRGKGPENYTLPDTKAQDQPPNRWLTTTRSNGPGHSLEGPQERPPTRKQRTWGKVGQKILISFMPIRMISELYTQRQRDVYMGFDCCHILNGHKYTHGYSRRDRWDRNQKES